METKSETLQAAGPFDPKQGQFWSTDTKLTIKEASLRYQKFGNDAVYPGYRELISQAVKSGRRLEFKNDSYLDALFLTDIMLQRAEKHIRFFSGAQADGFLSTLKASFESAIERIQLNEGFVRVVLLSHETPKLFLSFQERFKGIFDFALANASAPVKHFIVCDSILSRIEEPHPPLEPDMPADAIRATVYFNEPDESRRLESQFDYIWNLVRPKQRQTK